MRTYKDGMKKDSSNENWIDELSKSNDFIKFKTSSDLENDSYYSIYFYRTLIRSEVMHEQILPYLTKNYTLEDLMSQLPVQQLTITSDSSKIKSKLLKGYMAIQYGENKTDSLLVNISNNVSRTIGPPIMEATTLGPQVGFVEDMDVNINLIRNKLPISDLHVEELVVGKLSKTSVAVIYISGIADDENVNTVTQRIKDIQYDHIPDSSFISSMIGDNTHSIFPQSIPTERLDRTVGGLTEGKIAIVVDGSPNVLLTPALIDETFISMEDYYVNWVLATFFRFLRMFGFALSIFITPFYVAVLTYHYELIPPRLLESLVISRASVPFPPIFEVLFLELTIELVKEAGLRLPSKIGQTLGIVGGIVIGQAVVEAKLTSNILLILVGLGTLASYTSAIYKFNNTIRFIKFPVIIMAQLIGLLGIFMGFIYLMTHLLRLTSLGRPYIGSYPFRKTAFNDLWIRLPFAKQKKRPTNLRPATLFRATNDIKRPGPPSDFDE
ncbi:spore germination protein [Bacillus sp. AFS077874]|uniref:spore germination protein n=1 Tax=unclassified Bacillus (in: firmicutes) TaxID=185979 RepID=UPI000BEB48C8|nr:MULTISPECIES: spore germination protein [unclassified Bacillus (in: firmicutes)]PEC51084.1 spore germination protein [Bacillus sp. AFS096315]PFM81251.1 spore germination protein [Bacillus sp. AFS077874]